MTNDRRRQLVRIIERNPGLNFRDLMRTTGMKNGVLSHHLGSLERLGSIFVVRGPRQSRFYPPSISEQDSRIIRALRRQTPRLIIGALVLHDSLEFRQIVGHVPRSASTVSMYLSQLVQDGIVQTSLSERVKRYHLADRKTVDMLVDGCRPGLLDGPASGFEDIINSL